LTLEPPDPDFVARVRASYARQAVMATLGDELVEVRPGSATIRMPHRAEYAQQHGFLHAGIVSTIGDSACGYAAFSLMPADAGVLTVEYKVNLVAPARGEAFVARGEVVRPGRTLTVCRGEVFGLVGGEEKLVATLQSTVMALHGRADVRH
jgi:uncharacterized protein (TIGR00369 family)